MQLDLPHPRNDDMNPICGWANTGNAISFSICKSIVFLVQVSGRYLMVVKENGHVKVGGLEPN